MDAKNKSLVSVIVPVYNVERYLRECVDSILGQRYQNTEILLIDDGSTDNSGKICDEYAVKYPERVKVLHKRNGGLSSARNAGLDMAKGEYVSFIDSDDKILPEMYGDMVEAMERYNVDIVTSDFLPWDAGHKIKITKDKSYTGTSERALSLVLNWKLNCSACTKLYRRSVLTNIRFHEGLTNEDFPFICELFVKRHKIHVMDKGYYLYRYNDNSISTVLRPSFFDIFTNLEFVSGLIPATAKDLREDFKYYELTMHLMSGKKIVLCRKNKEYKYWLRKNRGYIIKSWRSILFDSRLNLRWRIKAVLSFFRLP